MWPPAGARTWSASSKSHSSYPDLGPVLPAMGYGEAQTRDLEATLRRGAEDGEQAVAIGTPIDLSAAIDIPLPHIRIRYELEVLDEPTLEDVLVPVLSRNGSGPG